MIMGEIKRFIRDDGIIKVSRGLKELYQKQERFAKNLYISMDESPLLMKSHKVLGFRLKKLL